jgi:hypothetical protein
MTALSMRFITPDVAIADVFNKKKFWFAKSRRTELEGKKLQNKKVNHHQEINQWKCELRQIELLFCKASTTATLTLQLMTFFFLMELRGELKSCCKYTLLIN